MICYYFGCSTFFLEADVSEFPFQKYLMIISKILGEVETHRDPWQKVRSPRFIFKRGNFSLILRLKEVT